MSSTPSLRLCRPASAGTSAVSVVAADALPEAAPDVRLAFPQAVSMLAVRQPARARAVIRFILMVLILPENSKRCYNENRDDPVFFSDLSTGRRNGRYLLLTSFPSVFVF